MKDIYRWDREDKLFAIEGLRQHPSTGKARPLLQLVVDDDPVVRGKAALALKDCSDDVLLEAADALMDPSSPETTILALEILGFTKGVDFSGRIQPLLEHEDVRVVKSAVEILHRLPVDSAAGLLHQCLDRYRPELNTALSRLVKGWNHPELLDVVKRWYDLAGTERAPDILRMTAALPSSGARDWVRERLEEEDVTSRQKRVIRWMLEADSVP